jgi:ADP-ribose pyrophosphatase YjhB (NUDIX family)
LADILEIIYAICDFKKIDKKELEKLRKKKAKERGKFKRRIILDEVKIMRSEKEPRIVVAAIIRNGNKLLLVKEILESGREYWIFPGGGVKFGENLEEAVKREIKEELGMEIEIEKLLTFKEAIFPEYNYHTIIFFFLAKPLGKLSIKEEKILDAHYFDFKEIEKLDLVDSARWAFEKLKVEFGEV